MAQRLLGVMLALGTVLLLAGCESGGAGGAASSSSGESVALSYAPQCPSATALHRALGYGGSWTMSSAKHLPNPHHEYADGSLKAEYELYCLYDSRDHNAYLYLTFTRHPAQSASERFAEMRQREQACDWPSLCSANGSGDPADPDIHLLEGESSYIAWDVSPPSSADYGEPYLAEVAAAARAGEGTCLLPFDLPQRLAAGTELELEGEVEGLQGFVRSSCGLPAESGVREVESEPGAAAAAPGTGTSNDEAGATKTYVAYTAAIDEADYARACELVTVSYKEGLPEPCPNLFARVFKGRTASAAQRAEDEQKAAEEIEGQISDGEVLWDGQQWLVNPQ